MRIDDEDINDLQPKDRDIAIVFQNYALYLRIKLYGAITPPPKLRRIPKPKSVGG